MTKMKAVYSTALVILALAPLVGACTGQGSPVAPTATVVVEPEPKGTACSASYDADLVVGKLNPSQNSELVPGQNITIVYRFQVVDKTNWKGFYLLRDDGKIWGPMALNAGGAASTSAACAGEFTVGFPVAKSTPQELGLYDWTYGHSFDMVIIMGDDRLSTGEWGVILWNNVKFQKELPLGYRVERRK